MKRSRVSLTAAAAFIAVLLTASAGCATQDLAALKTAAIEARAVSDDLDPVIADIQAELADAPGNAPLIAALKTARKEKSAYDAIADGYLAKIADVTEPADLIGEALAAIAPALPPPWGTYIGLAGTLIAGVSEARRRRLKRAAHNVITSIEKTKTDDIIDFEIGGNELRSRMSTDAQKLVEDVRAKLLPAKIKPLPVFVEDGQELTAA